VNAILVKDFSQRFYAEGASDDFQTARQTFLQSDWQKGIDLFLVCSFFTILSSRSNPYSVHSTTMECVSEDVNLLDDSKFKGKKVNDPVKTIEVKLLVKSVYGLFS
jgi:hypothetical protein